MVLAREAAWLLAAEAALVLVTEAARPLPAEAARPTREAAWLLAANGAWLLVTEAARLARETARVGRAGECRLGHVREAARLGSPVECRRLSGTGEPGGLLRSREGTLLGCASERTRLGRAREGTPRLGPGE